MLLAALECEDLTPPRQAVCAALAEHAYRPEVTADASHRDTGVVSAPRSLTAVEVEAARKIHARHPAGQPDYSA